MGLESIEDTSSGPNLGSRKTMSVNGQSESYFVQPNHASTKGRPAAQNSSELYILKRRATEAEMSNHTEESTQPAPFRE